MFIGYLTFLINIYLGICVFQLGISVNVKTFLSYRYILCLIAAMNITDFVLSDHIVKMPKTSQLAVYI